MTRGREDWIEPRRFGVLDIVSRPLDELMLRLEKAGQRIASAVAKSIIPMKTLCLPPVKPTKSRLCPSTEAVSSWYDAVGVKPGGESFPSSIQRAKSVDKRNQPHTSGAPRALGVQETGIERGS